MAVVTKRNAVIGWITLKVGKKVAPNLARREAKMLRRELQYKLLRLGRRR